MLGLTEVGAWMDLGLHASEVRRKEDASNRTARVVCVAAGERGGRCTGQCSVEASRMAPDDSSRSHVTRMRSRRTRRAPLLRMLYPHRRHLKPLTIHACLLRRLGCRTPPAQNRRHLHVQSCSVAQQAVAAPVLAQKPQAAAQTVGTPCPRSIATFDPCGPNPSDWGPHLARTEGRPPGIHSRNTSLKGLRRRTHADVRLGCMCGEENAQ